METRRKVLAELLKDAGSGLKSVSACVYKALKAYVTYPSSMAEDEWPYPKTQDSVLFSGLFGCVDGTIIATFGIALTNNPYCFLAAPAMGLFRAGQALYTNKRLELECADLKTLYKKFGQKLRDAYPL